ncbi:hypothetical protein [Janthinobacterium sp.]|uniref:hypothetical protein n=1 Tax=Janthinobacterium sp. TaxID=1871054 RepID=UPI002610C961|nr:hypothetical protein [Janthinobacterium sp.]
MLSYAQLDLVKALLLLHTLKAAPERLELVMKLHRHIIRAIVRTELRIQRLRRKRQIVSAAPKRQVSKEVAKNRKAKISSLRRREQELTHLLFLWRCFGDGIAFIYQSKYSLKHLYFDGEYKPKEGAGFMTENGRLKRGFSPEYRLLISAIKHNVPVVLSDITNIVRYGDVCALGGDDPLIIEVKTSGNRNARTGRQDEQRRLLAEFYANDGAPEFRGAINVRREALRLTEVEYGSIANQCIAEALQTSWCTATPEPGITYMACTTVDDEKFDQLGLGRTTLAVMLSAQSNHLPSYPFTLSLTPANCLAFIQQRFAFYVFIDMAEVKSAFARRGVYATVLMDGTSALQITKTPEDLMLGVFRVSELLFSRIATEFLSVEWFAEEFSRVFDGEMKTLSAEEADSILGLISAVPAGWENVRDCYAE